MRHTAVLLTLVMAPLSFVIFVFFHNPPQHCTNLDQPGNFLVSPLCDTEHRSSL